MFAGGVPERTNGAVLKTAGARKGARGFESHPRRLVSQNPLWQRGFGLLRLLSFYRSEPLRTAPRWRRLAQNWRTQPHRVTPLTRVRRAGTPEGVVATGPLGPSAGGGSGAFLVLADDGRRYWCKTTNNLQDPRVPANEQIV